MTVPTRQRTHLLAGPSLSGGSCGSISGDRGRVGRAGHRRGDRAVAARQEDRGRECHRLQGSGVRRRTPSSGPRGRRLIPSLRAPVRTNTSWGRGARVAPGLNRLRQNERRGGGAASRPRPPDSASGSARAVPEDSIVLRSRFPLRPRRHPGPVRATPPRPCGLAVPPDVEPVGRLSRAGGLRHVPDRHDDRPRAEVIRPRQISERSLGLLPLGLGRSLARRLLERHLQLQTGGRRAP
jgi:hypothetical protein